MHIYNDDNNYNNCIVFAQNASTTLHLFPGAYARRILRGDVFGAVIADHRLSAAFVCGIRRAGAGQVFFGGLNRALGALNSLVHAVPVFAQPCLRSRESFSGCHDLLFVCIMLLHYIMSYLFPIFHTV